MPTGTIDIQEASADFLVRDGIDLKLVSAAQRLSGARCHRAANLLHCYFLCTEVYRQAKDFKTARSALRDRDDSEVELRKFVFQARWHSRVL